MVSPITDAVKGTVVDKVERLRRADALERKLTRVGLVVLGIGIVALSAVALGAF